MGAARSQHACGLGAPRRPGEAHDVAQLGAQVVEALQGQVLGVAAHGPRDHEGIDDRRARFALRGRRTRLIGCLRRGRRREGNQALQQTAMAASGLEYADAAQTRFG